MAELPEIRHERIIKHELYLFRNILYGNQSTPRNHQKQNVTKADLLFICRLVEYARRKTSLSLGNFVLAHQILVSNRIYIHQLCKQNT